MTKFSLSGKTAIVTGGSSGIGRAIVEVFLEAGAKIHIIDINDEVAEKFLGELTADEAARTAYRRCDITNQAEVEEVFKDLHANSRLDILVNNAGVAHVGNAAETNGSDFDKVMKVNVYGAYHCLHACLPFMVADGGGVVLNIASTVSHVAIPNRFAYATSKGAALTMTYSVALDYIDKNIRCNAISPGRVHTPFVDGFIAKNYPGKEEEMFEKLSKDHPIGRMAEPVEIANLALYLCSDEAAYVTGSNHCIDGGFIKLKP